MFSVNVSTIFLHLCHLIRKLRHPDAPDFMSATLSKPMVQDELQTCIGCGFGIPRYANYCELCGVPVSLSAPKNGPVVTLPPLPEQYSNAPTTEPIHRLPVPTGTLLKAYRRRIHPQAGYETGIHRAMGG